MASRKKPKDVLVAEVVNDPKPKVSLDIRITQADIIESIVAEEEERLEDESKKIYEKITNVEKSILKEEKKIAKKMRAAIMKKHKSTITHLRNRFGKDNVKITDRHRWCPCSNDIKNLLPNHTQLPSDYVCIEVLSDEHDVRCDLHVGLSEKEYQNILLDNYPFDKAKELKKLKKRSFELQSNIANISKMGKKAKAKMVREFLSKSDDGRRMIDNIEEARKAFRNKLIEYNKNK